MVLQTNTGVAGILLLMGPPIFISTLIVLLIFCVGKKKNDDIENGIVTSSGSFTSKSSLKFAGIPAGEPQGQRVEQEVALSRTFQVEANKLPDANTYSQVTDAMQQSVACPDRRRSSQNDNRKGSVTSVDNKDGFPRPQDNAQYTVECSGESSGYARINYVEKTEPEIAYSVVDIAIERAQEQEYEVIGMEQVRKLSCELERIDSNAIANKELPYSSVTLKDQQQKDKDKANKPVAGTTFYPELSKNISIQGFDTQYPCEDSGASDLYDTVTEIPSESSQPPSTKTGHSKLNIFKQTKRRSKSMGENPVPSEDSAKEGDRKGTKKWQNSHGRRPRSDTEETKLRSPKTPPPPPLESLKSIKDGKKRMAPMECAGNSPTSIDGTTSTSPRLGALPSIPSMMPRMPESPHVFEDYNEDATYETVGSEESKLNATGAIEQKVPSQAKAVESESCKFAPVTNMGNRNPATGKMHIEVNSGAQVFTVHGDSSALRTEQLNKNLAKVAIKDDEVTQGNQDLSEMYAKVCKDKSKINKKLNTNKAEIKKHLFVDNINSASYIHPLGDKRNESFKRAIDDAQKPDDTDRTDHLAVLSNNTLSTDNATIVVVDNPGESLNSPTKTSRGISSTEILYTLDCDKDFSSIHVIDCQLKEYGEASSAVDDNAVGVTKDLYAHVDFDKKRESQKLSAMYARVDKPKSGRKTYHSKASQEIVNEEPSYEGAYKLIAGVQSLSEEKNKQDSSFKIGATPGASSMPGSNEDFEQSQY